MTNATMLLEEVLCANASHDVPTEVARMVERHRQTLLGLADALIAAGRSDEDVIAILQTASASFSTKLKSEIERVLS